MSIINVDTHYSEKEFPINPYASYLHFFQIPLILFHPKTTPPEYPTLPSIQMARRPTTLTMCWRNQVRPPTRSLNPRKLVIEWRIY